MNSSQDVTLTSRPSLSATKLKTKQGTLTELFSKCASKNPKLNKPNCSSPGPSDKTEINSTAESRKCFEEITTRGWSLNRDTSNSNRVSDDFLDDIIFSSQESLKENNDLTIVDSSPNSSPVKKTLQNDTISFKPVGANSAICDVINISSSVETPEKNVVQKKKRLVIISSDEETSHSSQEKEKKTTFRLKKPTRLISGSLKTNRNLSSPSKDKEQVENCADKSILPCRPKLPSSSNAAKNDGSPLLKKTTEGQVTNPDIGRATPKKLKSPNSKKSHMTSTNSRKLGKTSLEIREDTSPERSDECLQSWLNTMHSHPAVRFNPSSDANEEELRKIYNEFEDCEYAILDKSFSILCSLPDFVSELIPSLKGDSSLLKKLKIFRQMMKGKMRRTKTLMKKIKKSPCKENFDKEKINDLTEQKVMIKNNISKDNLSSRILKSPSGSVRLDSSFGKSQFSSESNYNESRALVCEYNVPKAEVTAEHEAIFQTSSFQEGDCSLNHNKSLEEMDIDIEPLQSSECGSTLDNELSENSVRSQNVLLAAKSLGGFKMKQPSKVLMTLTPTSTKELPLGVSANCSTLNQGSNITKSSTLSTSTSQHTKNSCGNLVNSSTTNQNHLFPSMKENTPFPQNFCDSSNTPPVSNKKFDSSLNNSIPLQKNLFEPSNKWESTQSARQLSSFNNSSCYDSPLPSSSQNMQPEYTPVFSKPLTPTNSVPRVPKSVYETPLRSESVEVESFSARNAKEFAKTNYPHSSEMTKMFRSKFGLHKFRPNQMEAINAALLNYDCFILMPTGGGKSLCYQLPAILSKGTTIVISPLRSLIFDQTQKLKSLDIEAAFLTSETSLSEANEIYHHLCTSKGQTNIKLLFVTPEKISSSDRLNSVFDTLYRNKLLARFVIDEAHCVSQWGHDFRPDYKKLSILRTKFPEVPIMALTATATPRVRKDILHQLSLQNPKWFLSSFDRPNLKYEVKRPESGREQLIEIAALLKTKFAKHCGIIYCLSRKDCDTVAQHLKLNGIKAAAYHAGLSDTARSDVQNKWITDKIKVVCATIAFGMGIDKPDVRFVIHHSIPKSLEGYYQEAGRAGRDGERAECILYYSAKDVKRMITLINNDSEGTAESKKTHMDNLMRMVSFCQNRIQCRRVLQLEYFGEKFSREQCRSRPSTTCDNCLSKDDYIEQDVTSIAIDIISTIKQICGDTSNSSWASNFTQNHIIDVFRGSNSKKIIQFGHNKLKIHGLGKSWTRSDSDRLLSQLFGEGYLATIHVPSREGMVNSYVKVGRKADLLFQRKAKVVLAMKKEGKEKAAGPSGANDSQTSSSENEELKKIQDACYAALMDKVKDIALQLHVSTNSVMNTEALKAMSQSLPETEEEMLNVVGVTKANFDKYGQQLIEVIREFSYARDVLLCSTAAGGCENDTGQSESMSNSPYFEAPEVVFASSKRRGKFRGRGRGKSKRGRSAASSSSRGRSVQRGRVGKRKTGRASPKKSSPKKASSSKNVFIPLPLF